MAPLLRRSVERARRVWALARAEHTSPRELGWSVALGVFVGCTPLVGLHAGIALGLATLLRLNRLWALLGSRVSTSGVLVWIVFAEIELGSRLRTGHFVPLVPSEALAEGRRLLLDDLLGMVPVGLALAGLLGSAAYAVRRRQLTRADRPAVPRSPTSESLR